MFLDDDSPMPYGVHKGTKMANVPAKYLMWLYDNGKASQGVRIYILKNRDALLNEINDGKQRPKSN